MPGNEAKRETGTKAEHALRWIEMRGVLYVLTQVPMIAFIASYLLDWISFFTASLLSMVVLLGPLPLWVRHRRQRATDPEDPAHHIGRYALFALVPVAVYDFVRIPNFYLLDSPYWDRWYDFGFQLTGQPADSSSALVAGTLVHFLQGWSLALGFYVLFAHHVLPGALAYLGVFLTVVYVVLFVRYADSSPTVSFIYKVAWDHFWMAVAAWAMTRGYERIWLRHRRLDPRLVTLGMACWVVPFLFAFVQAATLK